MADRVRVRELSNEEGSRLVRIVRRDSGSVVTWRRAQIVLLPDWVCDVIHNFDAHGFDSPYPRYRRGRPPTFDGDQRAEIKRIALSRPTDHGLPFSTWSLPKLAEFPGRRGGGRRQEPRGTAPAARQGKNRVLER
jgi:hypothetical protein